MFSSKRPSARNSIKAPAAPVAKKKMFVSKKKPAVANDDESASDSMVGIEVQRRHLEALELAKSRAPSATDQVSRLAAAHEQAAAATEEAGDASESTLVRVAAVARLAALGNGEVEAAARQQPPSVNPAAIAATNDQPSRALDVHSGSAGASLPLSMSDNYDAFRAYISDSLSQSSAAAVGGQMGQRVAMYADKLVRTIADRPNASPLPRVISSLESPLESTFLSQLVTETVANAELAPHLNYAGDIVDDMRKALPVSRRAHEERMLRVPRAGEPACSRGSDCRGNQIVCAGGGATLMAYFSEAEWAQYEDSRRTGAGTLPNRSGTCLLCIRYDVERFIVSMRNDNVQLRLHSPGSDKDPTPALVQPHFNLTNIPGEYRLEDCNTPVGSIYEGLLYPIVKPSLRHFVRTTDTLTGAVVFRQTFGYPRRVDSSLPEQPAAIRPF